MRRVNLSASVACALVVCILLVISAESNAGVVIRNSGFEDNLLPEGGVVYGAPDEWSIYSNSEGGYQNVSGVFIPDAIDGEMSVFINGILGGDSPWIAQELQNADGSAVLSAEGLLIDLEFYVGREFGTAGTYAPVVEAILECKVGSVWQTFASFTYDGAAQDLLKGTWARVHAPLTMTGLTGGYVNQQVVLTLFNRTDTGTDPGWHGQVALDALDIVPEPATITLLGIGALGLLRRQRRK